MLIAIAILTLIDIICTGIGVSGGYIGEGNPIADYLFGWSVIGTCILTGIVVGLLLWLVSRYVDRFAWIRFALIGVVAIKIGIVALHAVWISIVL